MEIRKNPNKILITTTECIKCPSWISAIKTRPDITIINETDDIFEELVAQYNILSAPYYIDFDPDTHEVLFETDDLYSLIKFLKI